MPPLLSFTRLSPLGAALLILIMVLMLYPVLPPALQQANAATTRYASPSGSGTACTSSSPCSLQTAINQAVAGDTVTASDGNYGNTYNINSNSGSSGSPIVVKSTNLHGAILQGNGTCANVGNPMDPNGFYVDRPWWIIEGFDIRDMCVGIAIGWNAGADNTEIRHNIISPYDRLGILGFAANLNIHHNVIANGFGTDAGTNDWAGIYGAGNNSVIQANWIYSEGNRKNSEPCCQAQGYGIVTGGDSTVQNLLIKGNVFMDASKVTGIRIFGNQNNPSGVGTCIDHPSPSCPQSSNNMVRDNIFAHGEGGGSLFTENASGNTSTNNVYLGLFQYTGPGAKGNDPGGNVYTHNTMIYDPRSSLGHSIECGSEVNSICDRATTVRDNLYYSTFSTNNRLLAAANQSDSISVKGTNLFWQPGSNTGYVTGYTFAGSDLTGSKPNFVNEAAGDYRLTAGSAGKGTASDGSDRGANFNSDLRIDWLQSVAQLPATEKIVSGQTSTSFNSSNGVDTSHYYQVWGYLKENSPYTGTETTNVEGVVSNVDLGYNNVGFYNLSPPNRYMYLSTAIAPDGTLNVSWGNSNSFDKVFIRRLPTAQEAYAIMAGSGSPTPTPTPTPSSSPKPIPGRIEAEDYVSYYDTTPGNAGDYTLRADDVDIKNTVDGPTIGYTDNGEWLAYNVSVSSTGSYTTQFRVANGMSTNASLHLELDGTNIGSVTIPPTGGWTTQSTITGPSVTPTSGTHTLKAVFDTTPVDLNWIQFTQSGGPTPTPTPGPTACSLYTPTTTIPTGFSSPYDVVSSPTTNLMNATCLNLTDARLDLGKGDPLQYIYNQGYLFKTGGTSWTPISYTSAESLIAGAWYPKTATATISLTSTELANPSYSLAYICSWVGSAWKCGCRDQACTQSYWMIQSFKR
jgi:hypothetical protein